MSIPPSDLNNPAYDGVTHCNILHMKAATRLGRLLSNLADVAVNHPEHGRFRTAEGLYYYLITGCQHEDLRSMDGYTAKREGSKLKKVWMDDFRDQFMKGVVDKIANHDELRDLFEKSSLPFTHYYVYRSKDPKVPPRVTMPKDSQWIVDEIQKLRDDPSIIKAAIR